MTTRQKVGIGTVIAGLATIVTGSVFIVFEVTPDWVAGVVQVLGYIAGLLGYKGVSK